MSSSFVILSFRLFAILPFCRDITLIKCLNLKSSFPHQIMQWWWHPQTPLLSPVNDALKMTEVTTWVVICPPFISSIVQNYTRDCCSVQNSICNSIQLYNKFTPSIQINHTVLKYWSANLLIVFRSNDSSMLILKYYCRDTH